MIDFKNVFKSYGARDIFNDASFRVEKGERAGVVGPNGSGKSTLFAMICDELSADRGEITVPQKVRIGLLHQQLDFFRRAIVDEARERTEGISFGISLGDIVGDHLDLQKEYVKVIRDMGIPWYNVIGNHDRNLDGKKEMYANETFESNFGPSTYAFRYGDTHFIVLDDIYMHLAPKGNPYKGGFSEDQFEFMENYVRLVGEDELIVFAYHIPIAYKENQFSILLRIKNLWDLTFMWMKMC